MPGVTVAPSLASGFRSAGNFIAEAESARALSTDGPDAGTNAPPTRGRAGARVHGWKHVAIEHRPPLWALMLGLPPNATAYAWAGHVRV